MTDLSKAISPLKEFSNQYQDSKKPNPSVYRFSLPYFIKICIPKQTPIIFVHLLPFCFVPLGDIFELTLVESYSRKSILRRKTISLEHFARLA